MFSARVAKKIERSEILNCVRRIFFTSLEGYAPESSFHLREFYQYGSGVLLKSKGRLYLLTASHVVRNATANVYLNDSPFWITAEDMKFGNLNLSDFIYPRRYYDDSWRGAGSLDASITELNPFILKIGTHLNWDDDEKFVDPADDVIGSTAILRGFPSELNQYKYKEEADGRWRALANVARATFRCEVKSRTADGDFMMKNLTTQSASFDYSGLSGGVVACDVAGTIKYLGIATDRTADGGEFYVASFHEIRRRFGTLYELPWQVLDEAYFLMHPFRRDMSYTELICELSGTKAFVHERHNDYLAQLTRSVDQPVSKGWFNNRHTLAQALLTYKGLLIQELASTLKLIAKKSDR
jgi:hypothetical protein